MKKYDRQTALDSLLLEPARNWKAGRFSVAGPLYPETIAWPDNVERTTHLSPREFVDPAIHRPAQPENRYRAALSYLGTWSADREAGVRAPLIEPARRLPDSRFVNRRAQYSRDFPWLPNIFFVNHLPPSEHPAFYCSSRVTLNVTRAPMAELGNCPSGRLFEAAACGAPVLSDYWEGLESFYTEGSEILVARSTEEAVGMITGSGEDLARIGRSAREKTLSCHTSDIRAAELERILEHARDHSLSEAACGA